MDLVNDADDDDESSGSSEEEESDVEGGPPPPDHVESEDSEVELDEKPPQTASAPGEAVVLTSPDPQQVPDSTPQPSAEDDAETRVKGLVATNLTNARAKQQRKHHSKRSAQTAGRARGSKAKQDKSRLVQVNNDGWE